jgi:hypothetical protein
LNKSNRNRSLDPSAIIKDCRRYRMLSEEQEGQLSREIREHYIELAIDCTPKGAEMLARWVQGAPGGEK